MAWKRAEERDRKPIIWRFHGEHMCRPELCVFTTLCLTKSSRRRFPKHSQSFTWQFSLIAWANFSRASSFATRCSLRRVFRLLDSVHNMHLRNPNTDMCALGVVQEKMFMFIAEIGTIFQIDGNRSDARNIHENTRGATEPGRTGELFSVENFPIFGSALQRSQGGCKLFRQTFRHSESCWTTAKCLLSIELRKVQLPLIKFVETRVIQLHPVLLKAQKLVLSEHRRDGLSIIFNLYFNHCVQRKK